MQATCPLSRHFVLFPEVDICVHMADCYVNSRMAYRLYSCDEVALPSQTCYTSICAAWVTINQSDFVCMT